MNIFDEYTSATVASCAQQGIFDGGYEKKTGRLFVKLNQNASGGFKVMFQNITDGTFRRAMPTMANHIIDEWTVSDMRACIYTGDISAPPEKTLQMNGESGWTDILFCGKKAKYVGPGEFFETDEFALSGRKGDYLCLEYSFCGGRMPCFEEVRLPVYVQSDGEWRFDVRMPLPSFIGIKKEKKSRIVYWGDSITQGIGPAINSYAHWTAVVSELIGEEYAHWNIGIGCGKARDAATEGAWYYKAKHGDIIFLCFGVNDVNAGFSTEEICKNLDKTVSLLKKHGCRVIVQTLPPFNYTDIKKERWEAVNEYIRTRMPGKADRVFDCVPVLGKPGEENIARYGGHPAAEGCRLWGEALYAAVSDIFTQN